MDMEAFVAVFFQWLFLNLPKKADTALSSIRTKFTTSPQCQLNHSHWIPLGTASTRTSVNWQPYIITACCCRAKAWSRDITVYAWFIWFKFQIPRPCCSWADSCSFSTAVGLTPTRIFQVKANKSIHLWEFIKCFNSYNCAFLLIFQLESTFGRLLNYTEREPSAKGKKEKKRKMVKS